MNIDTFLLLRQTMGLEQEDIAAALEINVRTIQRWEARQNPLPPFAQVWMDDRWQAWLDHVSSFLAQTEQAPEGSEVDLAVYRSQASLNAAGSTLTVRQASALNRALAVGLGLSDLQPVAHTVPHEA